jgi:uncharacterized protein YabN with tetrapyrrole methylase and pyrophosphatase domain
MRPTEVNNIVTRWIDTLKEEDIEDLNKIKKSWSSFLCKYKKTYSSKKGKKTVYSMFADMQRVKLSEKTPPVTSRNVVMKHISDEWKKLKNNKSEYDKFELECNMNDNISYEVSNCFHKFSLENREIIKKENLSKTPKEITNILQQKWLQMSIEEQSKYNIDI